MLGQLGAFALIVAVTLAGIGSLQWFVGATVLNAVVMLLWLMFTLRRGTGIRIRFERSQWWIWLKEAAPLAIGAALDTIYFRIDIVMLSIMASASAAGVYNIGYKFSDLIGAVPIAVMTPALTLMVAAWPHDQPAFRRTFRHTYVLLLVGAVGASVGVPRLRRAADPGALPEAGVRRRRRRGPPARGRPGAPLLHAARVHDAGRR